jgi:hypothetical protein
MSSWGSGENIRKGYSKFDRRVQARNPGNKSELRDEFIGEAVVAALGKTGDQEKIARKPMNSTGSISGSCTMLRIFLYKPVSKRTIKVVTAKTEATGKAKRETKIRAAIKAEISAVKYCYKQELMQALETNTEKMGYSIRSELSNEAKSKQTRQVASADTEPSNWVEQARAALIDRARGAAVEAQRKAGAASEETAKGAKKDAHGVIDAGRDSIRDGDTCSKNLGRRPSDPLCSKLLHSPNQATVL